MAISAEGPSLHQETLPDFVLIRTDQIDEGERLRPVDPVWAKALGQIMAKHGQQTPVEVCQLPGRNRWTLVSGGHRRAGAISSDIEFLRAEIVSADRDDRRLREVRDSLWSRSLTPIDRAAHIAEAVAIYKRRAGFDPTKDGRAASVTARWQKQMNDEADDTTATIAVVFGWSDDVAEQIGLSARTVRNDLLLYKRLAPSLVDRLRKARHPVLNNGTQLRALAKLDEHAQAKAVELLTVPGVSLNYGQPKTVAEAITHPLGPKPAGPKQRPDDKRQATFISTFERMTPAEQKGALATLAKHLPRGMRIVNASEPAPQATFSPKHVEYREEALFAIDTMRELVDGLLQDETVADERHDALHHANGQLQVARFTIAGNGFDLSETAA